MKTLVALLACLAWSSPAVAQMGDAGDAGHAADAGNIPHGRHTGPDDHGGRSGPSAGHSADAPANPYLITIDTRPWIEALRTDDLFVADPAIDSLAALGDYAIAALDAAWASAGTQARIHIVEVLSDIRTAATVEPLIRAAHDPSAEVRGDAVEALGRLGDADGSTAIEAALDDPSPRVMAKAATACGRVCSSPAALRRLVEMSIQPHPPSVANSARHSLRKLLSRGAADRGQVEVLVAEIVVPVMNDSGAGNRHLAALTAATASVPSAVPALHKCATDQIGTAPLTAVLCVQALGESRLDDAVGPLEELANAGHRILTPAACKALATLARTTPQATESAKACALAHRARVSDRKPQRPQP